MKAGGGWRRFALVWGACLGAVGCGGTDAGREPSESAREAPAPSTPTTPTPPVADTPPPATGTDGPELPGPEQPPPAAPAVCAPTGAGPYWFQEGEAVKVTLRCGTGHSAAGLRFTVSPLPAGATLDEASGTFTWTPGKAQAAVWNLTVTERSTGETGALKLGVADNFLAPGNVRELNPDTYTEEYGLPVLHLSYPGDITAGEYRPAQVVYRGHHYDIEVKYRGATSSSYPKRNYTLKFADEDEFNEAELAGGFKSRRKLVLITSFNDNSYVRPRLAFDLWNAMAPEHIQIKTYSAVLYVNGRFKGLYTVADHVDKHLMKQHGLAKDGDLFKAEFDDANFSRLDADGAPKQRLEQDFVKKEGVPEEGRVGAYDTLNALTAFVADANADTFRAQWGSRLDTQDYQDWWIFNTAILGTDSSAKNAYHYYDPVKRAPWRFIPWDLDASFGQVWDTHRISASALPNFSGDNAIFAHLLSDPTLSAPLRERYRTLLRGPLSKDKVLALLDSYEREIRPVALRDEAFWMERYRGFEFWKDRTDFTTHEQELAYIRQWVNERWSLLERRLP